jgi:hypothetical protein
MEDPNWKDNPINIDRVRELESKIANSKAKLEVDAEVFAKFRELLEEAK